MGSLGGLRLQVAVRMPAVCLDAVRRGFLGAVEALPTFSCVVRLFGSRRFPLRVNVILPAKGYSSPSPLVSAGEDGLGVSLPVGYL